MVDLLHDPLARVGKTSTGIGGNPSSKPVGNAYAMPWTSMG